MLPKILSSFSTLMVESIFQTINIVFQMRRLQCLVEVAVRILVKGIQVHAQSTREQHWVLQQIYMQVVLNNNQIIYFSWDGFNITVIPYQQCTRY